MDFFLHPFFYGLALGLFCTALALWRVITLKWELRKVRSHISDRIELEADSLHKIRVELEQVRKENEHLRVRIATDNETPQGRLRRDLEIFARAEKRMILNAPGFAPAWESAKTAAVGELEEEEAGRSLPRRVFGRLFGGANPAESTALPAPSPSTGAAGATGPVASEKP